MNEDKAPFCPISYDQEPTNPRGTAPIRLPSIPIATDLPSLIRAVNIIRDILRTLTTSLTVNNFYGGRITPAKTYGKRDYLMSDYESDWYQTGIDNKPGFVGKDPKNRAYVERMDAVKFRNNARDNDQSFDWRYAKPLTGEGTKGSPFEEDYFERIVAVHWKKKKDDKPKKDHPDYLTFRVDGVTYCAWDIDWDSDPKMIKTAIVAGGISNATVLNQSKSQTGWGYGSGGNQSWDAKGFTEFSDEYGHEHPYPPIGYQIFSSVTGGIDAIEATITCSGGSGYSASFKLGTITALKDGKPIREYKSIGPSKIYYMYEDARNHFIWFVTFEGHWVGPMGKDDPAPFILGDPIKPQMGQIVGGPGTPGWIGP